jgi:WD40 repeat protein
MLRFVFCIISLCIVSGVKGQPAEPILRLNSAFHTGVIYDISTDAQGKYLLTASEDKTARLWDARTGDILRILRPPIGYGKEGFLYACALSPDGQVAAVGGHTGASWNKADSSKVTVGNWTGYARQLKYSIYLFSTSTGELINNIDDIDAEILDLNFSPDGNYLAAALNGNRGVRIFHAKDGNEVRKLIAYSGAVRKAEFSPSGQLITIADDNYIRLYGKTFQLSATRSLTGKPLDFALSPDGLTIAVCCADQTTISILDMNDLTLINTISALSFEKKSINAVVFSPDGNIYAGGNIDSNGKRQIKFVKGNSRISIPAGSGDIIGMKALPDGSVVFGTSYPEIGRILPDNKSPDGWVGNNGTYIRTADMKMAIAPKQWELFQLNEDGTEIGLLGIDRKVLYFSILDRELKIAPSSLPTATDRNLSKNIRMTGWKNGNAPCLNGKILKILDEGEVGRCVDVSHDGTRILLGTSKQIICIDHQGSVLWKHPLMEECVAIKTAGDGKIAAAALGNGTCSWFDMSEGSRLLTLFAHSDNRRWVLWTPAGYYDCAVGADELIGWNVNQSKKEASAFYPIAQFRKTFYNLEIIDKSLGGHTQLAQRVGKTPDKPVSDSVNSIAQVLPPEVTIVTPQSGTSVKDRQIRLRYHVSISGQEPVESVKILIDGRPVQLLSSITPGANEAMVDIPERDCEISIIAKNKFSTGVPASAKIKWTGVKEEDILKPKLYILAVGISQYQDRDLTLQFASKDAMDFTKIMAKQKGLLYSDVVIKLLTDANASKFNILDGLEWIQKETTSRDVSMIFFAGHGINDNAGTFFYLPVEAETERLRTTCINYVDIKQTVASIAGKVILFMDACHSGDVMGSTRRAIIDINGVVNELSSAENGAVVFTSSTGRQYSLEDATWNNGAFTKSLVEGLGGKADLFGRKNISIKTLDAFITQRVKELTKGKQAPTTIIPASIPDFPIAIVK